MSKESADSGIYDLDDPSYSHVITEHSPADAIAQVERNFQPPYELGGSIDRQCTVQNLPGTRGYRGWSLKVRVNGGPLLNKSARRGSRALMAS